MVVLDRHAGQRGVLRRILRFPAIVDVVVLEHIAPAKAHIHILRVAEAVELPYARHVHRCPRRVVEVSLVEIGGALVGIGHPTELPRTFEREIISRLRKVAGLSLSLILVGEEIGVQLVAVDLVDLLVMPFRPRRHGRSHGRGHARSGGFRLGRSWLSARRQANKRDSR